MTKHEDRDRHRQSNGRVQKYQHKELAITFDPVAFKYIGKRVDSCVQRKYTTVGENCNMCFKMVKCDAKLVKSLLFSYGFIQCSSKNTKCNLLWTNTHLSTHSMRELRWWQRINHFPRSWMLTKKDLLYENVKRMAIHYGTDMFNFIPDFFCTPLNPESLSKLRECCEDVELGKSVPFIVKPAGGSYGRGIFFLDKAEQISLIDNTQRMIISRYIDRPYLINGLKWDLRIYVLITSYYPLVAYIYSEGLTRFAVHKYANECGNFADVNQHLTNYTLNKDSDAFIRNTDCTVENMGHKWTLGAVLRELEKQEVDTGLLMVRIEDLVIKTLLSIQPKVAAMCRKLNLHPKCCFELFGFDILVDENLKPWLLEVNLSPSLICDSPLDSLLKSHLFANVLNIAQIPLVCDKNSQNAPYDIEQENNLQQQEAANLIEKDEEEERAVPTICSSSTDSYFASSMVPSISTVDSEEDSSSSGMNADTTTNGNVPEKNGQKSLTPVQHRIGKVRKVQFTQKICYSADRITPQYLERVKCLFEKLKSEEKRKGHFNRIFPRQYTWQMYSSIIEDCGQERWDEALHAKLASEQQHEQQQELTIQDILLTHQQLMDSKKFVHRDQLSPLVRDVILGQALRAANCYKQRLYNKDVLNNPYPSVLPKVRQNARRRTRSQVEADEMRRKRLEQKKAEIDMAICNEMEKTAATTTITPSSAPPLSELNLNLLQQQQQCKDGLANGAAADVLQNQKTHNLQQQQQQSISHAATC